MNQLTLQSFMKKHRDFYLGALDNTIILDVDCKKRQEHITDEEIEDLKRIGYENVLSDIDFTVMCCGVASFMKISDKVEFDGISKHDAEPAILLRGKYIICKNLAEQERIVKMIEGLNFSKTCWSPDVFLKMIYIHNDYDNKFTNCYDDGDGSELHNILPERIITTKQLELMYDKYINNINSNQK